MPRVVYVPEPHVVRQKEIVKSKYTYTMYLLSNRNEKRASVRQPHEYYA